MNTEEPQHSDKNENTQVDFALVVGVPILAILIIACIVILTILCVKKKQWKREGRGGSGVYGEPVTESEHHTEGGSHNDVDVSVVTIPSLNINMLDETVDSTPETHTLQTIPARTNTPITTRDAHTEHREETPGVRPEHREETRDVPPDHREETRDAPPDHREETRDAPIEIGVEETRDVRIEEGGEESEEDNTAHGQANNSYVVDDADHAHNMEEGTSGVLLD